MKPETVISMGIGFLIIGFFLLLAGIILGASFGAKEPGGDAENKIRGGGVIMLGPIPLVFGTDEKASNLSMTLAIIIMLLAAFIMLLARHQ